MSSKAATSGDFDEKKIEYHQLSKFYSFVLINVANYIIDGLVPKVLTTDSCNGKRERWIEVIGFEHKPTDFYKKFTKHCIEAGEFLSKKRFDLDFLKDLLAPIVELDIFERPRRKTFDESQLAIPSYILSDVEIIKLADKNITDFDMYKALRVMKTPILNFKFLDIENWKCIEPFIFFFKDKVEPSKYKPNSIILKNSEKANSNYFIDHKESFDNALFVFLRQFLYLRLKIMFGETIAKLWSTWVKFNDCIFNKYPVFPSGLLSGANVRFDSKLDLDQLEKLSYVYLHRLRYMFKSLTSAHYKIAISEIESRKLNSTIKATKTVDSYVFEELNDVLYFDLVNIDIENISFKKLETKSMAKSFYKLTLSLKNVMSSISDIMEESNYNKDKEFFNLRYEFVPDLRPDSYNAKIYNDTEELKVRLSQRETYSLFEDFFSNAYKTDPVDNNMYDQRRIELLFNVYRYFLDELHNFLDVNQNIEQLSQFDDYYRVISYECSYISIKSIHKYFEQVYNFGKLFFSNDELLENDTNSTSVLNCFITKLFDFNDNVCFNQLLLMYFFRFPNLKSLFFKF